MSAPAATAPASSAHKIVSLDSNPITPVQTRFLIDQIRKAKKIKSAIAFLRPVDHVALNIPTYPDIIKTPMDLSTIDEKLKHGKYGSADDVMADFDTMLQNSNIFNGTAHPVSVAGQSLRAYFDKCVSSMPKGEAAKPVDKPKKASPAPVKATRPARVIPPPTPTAKSPTETKSAGYLNEHGVPIIRRDSSAQNDRPKREIHPPKRDLPSASARPKKKKTQLELKFCDTVLAELKKKKYEGFTFPFMLPVDPVALNIPNYHRIIKKPMDFSTVEKNLKDGIYTSAKDFHSEVKLIFQNCYKFNPQTDGVYKMGKMTEETFDLEWAKKDSWIANNMPQSEPATEDEEDEDEEEEEESEDSAMARMKEIQAQIAALSAEAMQLTSTPKTVPKAGKSKIVKPASSKTKSAPKPAVVAAPKAPKPKAKTPKVRILTMEQKREVSDGITMLDDGPMRSAVAIIRAGVPALANVNDDELELDIDEIPNDVLVKLWDFVRKHVPKKEREPSPDFVDDEDDDNYQAKGSTGGAGGRRKNKPMKAAEQVSRIAALEGLLKGEGSGASASPPAAAPAKREHAQEETEEDDGSSESEAE